ATVDKLNAMIDDLNAGKGTAGKFLKDPVLYNNANETIANVKKLTDDVSAGKGALGKLAKDEQFAAKLQNTMDKLSSITDRLAADWGTCLSTAAYLIFGPALPWLHLSLNSSVRGAMRIIKTTSFVVCVACLSLAQAAPSAEKAQGGNVRFSADMLDKNIDPC